MKPAKGKDDKKAKVKINKQVYNRYKKVKHIEEYVEKHAQTLHS